MPLWFTFSDEYLRYYAFVALVKRTREGNLLLRHYLVGAS